MNASEINTLRVRYKQRTAAGHAQPNAEMILRLLGAVERQAAIIAMLRPRLTFANRVRLDAAVERV